MVGGEGCEGKAVMSTSALQSALSAHLREAGDLGEQSGRED